MGLNSKTIITESIIPIPLLKSFAKTAAKFAIKTADGIASELGLAAKSTKKMFDDLDIAIKSGDNVAAKSLVTNIVNNLDNTALTNLANDILSDTADDALMSVITKRTQSLKSAGMMDDAIRTQINKDLDILLDDIPDELKNAIKISANNITNKAIKNTSISTTGVITSNGILVKLSESPIWNKFMGKFPELKNTYLSRIDDLIDAGAKSEDEIFNILERQAAKELKPSVWQKIKGFKATNPKTFKFLIYAVGFGFAVKVAGKVGVLPIIGKSICELAIGKSDAWCVSLFSSAYEEGSDTENTNLNGNCPGNSKFIDEVKSAYGDNYDSTKLGDFNDETCTGTYDGTQYTWNGTSFGG